MKDLINDVLNFTRETVDKAAGTADAFIAAARVVYEHLLEKGMTPDQAMDATERLFRELADKIESEYINL